MRKPGPLRFSSYTVEGDLRALQQYLSSSATTYCLIPAIQLRQIESQARQLLETHHKPAQPLTIEPSTSRRKPKPPKPLLASDTHWSNFFAALLHLPIEDTIQVKRHIAELFAAEFAAWWEDCIGLKLACYAVDCDIAGLAPVDLKDKIQELGQPATQVVIEETRVKVRKQQEKRLDRQRKPMFKRVKQYRISKVRRFLFRPINLHN